MSEDQDLLARIGQLAGMKGNIVANFALLNNHKAISISTKLSHPRHNLQVMALQEQAHLVHIPPEVPAVGDPRVQLPTEREEEALPDGPQPEAAYVTKYGRHKQLINSSVLDKVTQQRKQTIADSQRRKVLANDQLERQRMHRYMEGLSKAQRGSNTQSSQSANRQAHRVEIDGLCFDILKDGSKLARIYGPNDTSLSTPKRTTVQGVTFVRSKHGNLYRSGMVRASKYAHVRVNPSAPVCKEFANLGYCSDGANCSNRHVHECPDYANTGTCRKKRCDLPHVDRAGQIRRHAAQSTEAGDASNSPINIEANQSDISSDEENDVETDGEDVDSEDLADDLIEGVDSLGRQAVAEQHDFVGF
ncbi:MAG: hypothetical protein Q9170_000384 [Blastenia crenularia]